MRLSNSHGSCPSPKAALCLRFPESSEPPHHVTIGSRCSDAERDIVHTYPPPAEILPRHPSASPRWHSFLKYLASGVLLEHIAERHPIGVTTFTLPIPQTIWQSRLQRRRKASPRVERGSPRDLLPHRSRFVDKVPVSELSRAVQVCQRGSNLPSADPSSLQSNQ